MQSVWIYTMCSSTRALLLPHVCAGASAKASWLSPIMLNYLQTPTGPSRTAVATCCSVLRPPFAQRFRGQTADGCIPVAHITRASRACFPRAPDAHASLAQDALSAGVDLPKIARSARLGAARQVGLAFFCSAWLDAGLAFFGLDWFNLV